MKLNKDKVDMIVKREFEKSVQREMVNAKFTSLIDVKTQLTD